MHAIDKFLNNITMYRLVLYILGILATLSLVFGFMGRLGSTPTELLISFVLLTASAFLFDHGFGRLFNQPVNQESSLITACILFLIVQPADSAMGGVALLAAGAVSSIAKYVLSYNGKHIFNPAAFAAAVLSLTGLQATTWWVGNSLFWPFTLLF